MELISKEFDIFHVKDALTDIQCEIIINSFENSDLKRQGAVANNVVSSIKLSTDIGVPKGHPDWMGVDNILYKSASAIVDLHKENYMHSELFFMSDTGYQIQKYEPNVGNYNWHCDSDDGTDTPYRQGAIIWYLNTVKEGGETDFFGKKNIRPVRGHAVLFPPFWTHTHRGCIPVNQEKYIVTTFLEKRKT